jgi:hypothetical protein
MRRHDQQRGGAGRQSPPVGACVTIFHVRDAAPVKELVTALHPRPARRRGGSSRERGGRSTSQKASRARAAKHPPLFLVDDEHLILVAPSRAWATRGRRAVERALGDAVAHVETRSIKIPRPVAGRVPRRREERGRRGRGGSSTERSRRCATWNPRRATGCSPLSPRV